MHVLQSSMPKASNPMVYKARRLKSKRHINSQLKASITSFWQTIYNILFQKKLSRDLWFNQNKFKIVANAKPYWNHSYKQIIKKKKKSMKRTMKVGLKKKKTTEICLEKNNFWDLPIPYLGYGSIVTL